MNPTNPRLRPDTPQLVSIIVPVYNEREVLPLFYERTTGILKTLGIAYELVFIDDGSKDDSVNYLFELAARESVIKVLRLSRNFGKEAAVTAGIDYAQGSAIIIIDADLQDPPEEIPRMIAAWQAGADVVCMKRLERHGETRFKRYSAHLFYRLLNRLSQVDIPEDTGDFRLMSRRAVDALKQLPERQRYMKGLFAWIGMPTVVLLYNRDARAAGTSKWGYGGLFGLAFEGITSFSTAPLRWATNLGLVTAMAGILFGSWIVLKTLLFGEAVQGYPSMMAMITFLGGIQLLGIGIVGEYVGKTYLESKQRPVYLIRDMVQSHTLSQTQTQHSSHSIPLERPTRVASL